MRVLLLADIHSNLTALQAVIRGAHSQGPVDAIWSLGDQVGYGPDPVACLDLLKASDALCIAGNHDAAVAGHASLEEFNMYAATACVWTGAQLGESEEDALQALSPTAQEAGCTLVHGSPRDPIWEYMAGPDVAEENFPAFDTPLCFVGHTHMPSVFEWLEGEPPGSRVSARLLDDGEVVEVKDRRLIYNPGGVGQPRDGDPRASYAVYDSAAATLAHHRVTYDIKAVQGRMEAAGLPGYLINRLARGR
jgi:diadenosine tetraphosphatase ApaH/serine/threonine PP2A family protein phosphatase